MMQLTPEQSAALPGLVWLLTAKRGAGKTTVFAWAYLDKAILNLGEFIDLTFTGKFSDDTERQMFKARLQDVYVKRNLHADYYLSFKGDCMRMTYVNEAEFKRKQKAKSE